MIFWVSILLFTSNSFAQNSSKVLPATLLDKEISLTFRDKSIAEVLGTISANYNLRFSYVTNDIPLTKLVSGSFSDTPLSLVLERLFYGTNVKYYALSKQIVLKVEEPVIVTAPVKTDTVIQALSKSVLTQDSVATKTIQVRNTGKDSTVSGRFLGFDFLSLFRKKHKLSEDTMVLALANDTLIKDTSQAVKEKKEKQQKKFLRALKRAKSFENRWSAGVMALAGYSYRSLDGQSEEVKLRNNYETKKFSPGCGISLRYAINKYFFVSSGLQYTVFGENGNYSKDYRKTYINRPGPGQPGQSNQLFYILRDTSFKYSTSYQYLGIPVMVGVKTISRLSMGANAGFLVNFLIKHTNTFPHSPSEPYKPGGSYFDPNLDGNKHALRKMNLTAFVALELAYKLNAKIGLSLSPVFRYSLTSIYKSDDSVSSRPYIYAIGIGVRYYFDIR